MPNSSFDEVSQGGSLDGMVGVHRVHIARAAENTEVKYQPMAVDFTRH